MKLADIVIEGIKPLDKALDKILQDSAKNKEQEIKNRTKVLGKANKDKSVLDMTDDEISKIFGKEKLKAMASVLNRVRKKKETDKKRSLEKPPKTQRGSKKPIEDRILSGGSLGISGASKKEIKPGVFQFKSTGKFALDAIVDNNKKTVKLLKVQTDDRLFILQTAQNLGYKVS